MKVIHLSCGDSKGAYYGAYRTHNNFLKYGHESKMFVLEKTTPDQFVYSTKDSYFIFRKWLDRILRRLFVVRGMKKEHTYLLYYSSNSVGKIIDRLSESPDLIIVYYVAGFLSDRDIWLLQNKLGSKVLFYLMDVAALTGGCHYPWECQGYHSSCESCPALYKPAQVIAKKTMERRKVIYNQMDSMFISCSSWIDDKITASALQAKYPSKKILIGIEPEIFTPRNRQIANENLGLNIPLDKKVILIGAQTLKDVRKGVSLLLEALNTLSNKKSELDDVVLLSVGDDIDSALISGVEHICIPFIKDKSLYPFIYNLADVFICPSIEDAGPMMINESILSGTPVIAFDVGVARDLILDSYSGFICKDKSVKSLRENIMKFLSLSMSDINFMKERARAIGLQKTTSEVQVKLFTSILDSE
ncbi:glycosyltransferase [Aeromonas sp. 82P]|uniref:glycosyltransferase n=1 Tax=Aeromonas sp. 82P TaxID=3452726 RepID=UPI003F79603E